MPRHRLCLVLLFCVFLLAACSRAASDLRQIALPVAPHTLDSELVVPLINADKVTLYSIDIPIQDPVFLKKYPKTFRQYPLLGQVELQGPEAREAADEFLAVTQSPQRLAPACFDPHHALVIEKDGHLYEYLVCYTCGVMEVYRDGKLVGGKSADGHPQVLNALLARHHVDISELANDAFFA